MGTQQANYKHTAGHNGRSGVTLGGQHGTESEADLLAGGDKQGGRWRQPASEGDLAQRPPLATTLQQLRLIRQHLPITAVNVVRQLRHLLPIGEHQLGG